MVLRLMGKESVLLCVCVNDFFRGGAEIRRAADFVLRKLDECPTYPCGLIREHAANISREFLSENQGKRVYKT